jgi:hypothetical protein
MLLLSFRKGGVERINKKPKGGEIKKKMQQKKIVVSIGIVALVTVISLSTIGVWTAAATVVEPKMNYQGRLLDSSGDPVNDIVTMSFRLYNVSTGGTALWSENKTVQVVSGLFNTNLSYLDVEDFDQALWLEIVVEGDTLSPRQQLLGAPYAFSLVPGAVVSDSQWSPLLTVNNLLGDGVRGLSGSGTGGFFDGYYGVWGNGSGYGVIGHGVYYGGYFWSDEGDGVYARSYGSGIFDDAVYARSNEGRGVYGRSYNNTGVYGYSDNSHGVYGDGGSNWGNYGGYFDGYHGVYGNGYYGVYGNGSYGVFGNGYYTGVYGYSREGRGVYGYSYNNTGGYFYSANDNGVYGYSNRYTGGEFPSGGVGVYGVARSGTVDGVGVKGAGPFGVRGEGTTTGVYGSSSGTGVYGYSSGSYANSYGVYGRSNNYIGVRGIGGSGGGDYGGYFDGYYGVYGNGTGYGGYFKGGSSGVHGGGGGGYGVHGWSNDYIGGYFGTSNANSYGVYSYGDLRVIGDITKTGTVSFVEDHPEDPTKEIVYVCLEGGEAGTYTRGSAQLTNGVATVQLPEHFSMVTSSEGLTAQVTPTADCNGLYVVSKSPTEITVKELNGGTSDATFDYLVNGVRKGYENYQAIQDKTPEILDMGPTLEPVKEEPQIPPEPGPVEEPVDKEPVTPPEPNPVPEHVDEEPAPLELSSP